MKRHMYTGMGVSELRKTCAENVFGIDTHIGVYIKCAANADISTVCENEMCKLKKQCLRRGRAAENVDTPDDVYKGDCGKAAETARFAGAEGKKS